MKKRVSSWVWNYFDKAKTIPRIDLGPDRFAYVCQVLLPQGRKCGKAILAESKGSTTALAKHLKSFHALVAPKLMTELVGNDSTSNLSIRSFLERRMQLPVEINKANTRFMTLRAILCNNLAFNFVESPTIQQWLTFFSPIAPSLIETATTYRTTILRRTYYGCLAALRLFFASVSSKVALTGDIWTAFMKHAFLGLRAHWIDDDFKYHSTTLGFVPMAGSH
ncbi:hypothetical protein HDU99_009627, partial [Rhizoclosmatium hyalinum]